MSIESCLTSYYALFKRTAPELPPVHHIEIPLIQRDYAQGREGAEVKRIRDGFLGALVDALTKAPGLCLDFVYGDVKDGTLQPLDGQQRLTTLFLLHWYLACRVGCLETENEWKAFTYATRPSARLFCQKLVLHPFSPATSKIAPWIKDQPWYLQTWQHDPTVQSMLMMIEAIHDRFEKEKVDAQSAWTRLTDEVSPAITFHLLPIHQMGSGEEIYIKMNSRGKPLTPFENFKARLGQLFERSSPLRAAEFGRLVDGDWTDVFWRARGKGTEIDEKFLRFFHFVIELCQWRQGIVGTLDVTDLYPLAEQMCGEKNPQADEHLKFLFDAFNIWIDRDVAAEFERWFRSPNSEQADVGENEKVLLFGVGKSDLNLFEKCCADYGKLQRPGGPRIFGWGEIHLLYAVILHYIYETEDFPRRLRIVRNLIEASADQLRQDKMPDLIADVYRVVVGRTLDEVRSFNPGQIADEREKTVLVKNTPTLEAAMFRLEDHDLLRGRLFAFELDPAVFEARAETFHRVFAQEVDGMAITGALLATGDYSRTQSGGRFFQFGPANRNDGRWRALLADGSRAALRKTREVLGGFLDVVAGGELPGVFGQIRDQWLEDCEQQAFFDWRYYFVKYPVMRAGDSGIYACEERRLSYDLCMLNRTRMSSYYRDPYLSAIHRESGVRAGLQEPIFSGYEWQPRRLRLVRSGTEIRCLPQGFEISAPGDEVQRAAFTKVAAAHGLDADGSLRIPQIDQGGLHVDTFDRIQVGARLVRGLVEAGL